MGVHWTDLFLRVVSNIIHASIWPNIKNLSAFSIKHNAAKNSIRTFTIEYPPNIKLLLNQFTPFVVFVRCL